MNLSPLRFGIWLAFALVGFAGGAVYFRAGSNPPEAQRPAANNRPKDKLSALGSPSSESSKQERDSDAFERARRSKKSGLGQAIRSHMTLVRDTPLADLPELLLRYERSMPSEESIGGIAREAIIARLLAEDPDLALEFALTGRSETLRPGRLVTELRESFSYKEVLAKIYQGQVPQQVSEFLHSLLTHEIHQDHSKGWQLALENDRVDLNRLANQFPGKELIDLVILADHPRAREIDSAVLANSFTALLASLDHEVVSSRLSQLENPEQRMAVLQGIGLVLRNLEPAEAENLIGETRSSQERLEFYRALVSGNRGQNAMASRFPPASRTESISAALKIADPAIRDFLVEEKLTLWKSLVPDEAKTWAEENGRSELFERLHPVPAFSPQFDPSDRSDAFDHLFVPPGSVTE